MKIETEIEDGEKDRQDQPHQHCRFNSKRSGCPLTSCSAAAHGQLMHSGTFFLKACHGAGFFTS